MVYREFIARELLFLSCIGSFHTFRMFVFAGLDQRTCLKRRNTQESVDLSILFFYMLSALPVSEVFHEKNYRDLKQNFCNVFFDETRHAVVTLFASVSRCFSMQRL